MAKARPEVLWFGTPPPPEPNPYGIWRAEIWRLGP